MKRLSDQTLYEIIEVSVDSAPEEIARACDRAAATYGPGSLVTYTLASTEESTLLSSRIEEARAVLLDASARSRYDDRIGVRPHATPAPAPPPWPPPEVEPLAVEPLQVSPGLPVVTPAPLPVAEPQGPHAEAPAWGAAAQDGATPAPPPPAPAAAPIALTHAVAPILLDKEVQPPRPLLVPEGAAWSGELLRRVRESRGLTVQQVAERTRITRHHLENIEQDKFKALPAAVYLRGIIMSLARELRLDGQKVARSYLDRMGAGSEGDPKG